MRRTHPRHLVALVLVLCLLLSCIPVAAAVSETHDIQLQEVPAAAEALQAETAELPELDTPAPDENLRVIIMFQEEPVIEKKAIPPAACPAMPPPWPTVPHWRRSRHKPWRQ